MKTAHDNLSYYRATATPYEPFPRFEGDMKVDVAILGGGYTGLSAALELAEAGYSVAVLEGETVGFGASGRNGGQVCTGFHQSLSEIEKNLGRDTAETCKDVGFNAPKLIADRVERFNINCDLKWGYIHAAEKSSHVPELQEMHEDWEKWGYTGSQLYDKSGARDVVGSDIYQGALWEPGAGHIHPLNYCIGLAEAARGLGAKIFENSPVLDVDSGTNPSLKTAHGTLSANFLILAGNAYLKEKVPYLYRRIMPVGSYILATEPLGENRAKGLIPNDEAICNTNFIVDYYRLSGDKRMLFGGRATYSGLEPNDLGSFVRPRMLRVFPQLDDVQIEHVWGGWIGITVSRMPHLGRIGDSTFFAQGFSGHGVALSNMSGKLIADAVRGQSEKFDHMSGFTPPPFPGGRFRTPLLTLGMFWYRMKDILS